MRLKGKVALITGGAKGQGAAEARLFAQEGANVIIADVLDSQGAKVEAEINETGCKCLYLHLDVSNKEDWDSAVYSALTRFGKLDILVNNAGVAVWGTNDETTEEEWDRVMDINAKGVFLGTQSVIPEMKKAGGGSIVNISSISGIVGQAGIQPVYNASKGAVRIFTKSIAIQYASDGIRANSVHPGPIDTDMIHDRISGKENEERIRNTVPLGRPAEPVEVAYGVLFLASDESSYMTGSELVIDGGVTAM